MRRLLSLLQRYDHVSWERVCSGMGLVLVNIFYLLRRTGGRSVAHRRARRIGRPDRDQTFEIFVDIYRAEAGNMALRVRARGGVYLAGGIAAKNTRFFTDGRFVNAFLRKGRFREKLQEMPIDLITDEKVDVRGAAEMARRLASGLTLKPPVDGR